MQLSLRDDKARGPTWPDKIQYVEQCIARGSLCPHKQVPSHFRF